MVAQQPYRCLSSAFPGDAARLRGVVRVLREWCLARSAPASPLAHACALHLLCRDAGFLHDAGMMVLAWLGVCSVMLLATVFARDVWSVSLPLARSLVTYALHLLYEGAEGLQRCQDEGVGLSDARTIPCEHFCVEHS